LAVRVRRRRGMPRFHFGKDLNVEASDQGSCVMDQPEAAHVGFAGGSGDDEGRRVRERRATAEVE
jgi:hypothetical protein